MTENKGITYCAKTDKHLKAYAKQTYLHCIQKQTHNHNYASCRLKNIATIFILTPNAIVNRNNIVFIPITNKLEKYY